MKAFSFTKMQALGNDFMVIDNRANDWPLSPPFIQHLSDRHFGIGFDQLLVIENDNTAQADFAYRIFNADGGEVGQCGNGARALARYLRDKHLSDKNPIRVSTQDRYLDLFFESNGHITVDMGLPKHIQSISLTLENTTYALLCVDMGNPHAVMFCDNVDTIPLERIGTLLQTHPQFPQGVNVEWVERRSDNEFRARVFERGVGETLACGSGACAIAVAARLQQQAPENMLIQLLGGELSLRWQGEDHAVFLTGPADFVFEGEPSEGVFSA